MSFGLAPGDATPMLDEPLFVVRVKSTRFSYAPLPESGALRGFDVELHRVEEGGIYGNGVWQYRKDLTEAGLVGSQDSIKGDLPYEYVPDQVVQGFEAVRLTDIPIVGYNLFNYGWRVVAADGVKRMDDEDDATPPYDFSEIIPRTIDLQRLLVNIAFEARRADPSLPALKHGAFGFDSILEHNDVSVVESSPGFPPDPIAALWFYMLAGDEVSIDGVPHEIPESMAAYLTGERPQYDEALTWAAQLREHGWARDSKIRRYAHFRPRLLATYDPYLAVLSAQ